VPRHARHQPHPHAQHRCREHEGPASLLFLTSSLAARFLRACLVGRHSYEHGILSDARHAFVAGACSRATTPTRCPSAASSRRSTSTWKVIKLAPCCLCPHSVSALACIDRAFEIAAAISPSFSPQHEALNGLGFLAGTHYSLSTVFEEETQDVTGQELLARSHTTLESCMEFWHVFRYALSQKNITGAESQNCISPQEDSSISGMPVGALRPTHQDSSGPEISSSSSQVLSPLIPSSSSAPTSPNRTSTIEAHDLLLAEVLIIFTARSRLPCSYVRCFVTPELAWHSGISRVGRRKNTRSRRAGWQKSTGSRIDCRFDRSAPPD